MDNNRYQLEGRTPFSESLIWELNRTYYQKKGLESWRDGTVPHQHTSNALVGKTYAELILAFLKDLAAKGKIQEKVYILELGAGHGRLAFHILQHLTRIMEEADLVLPPFCYVLSDIIEDSLQFFQQHAQFQTYFEQGILDVAYFDAIGTKSIELRYAGHTISAQNLKQPLVALANYFFDSLPNDLFHFEQGKIGACSIALEMDENPENMDEGDLLEAVDLIYDETPTDAEFYKQPILNEILKYYRTTIPNAYLLFPEKGMQCLQNLQQLSQKGLILLSMDKGFHEIHDLQKKKAPEMITHGSMSFWVNYHALEMYCKKHKGTSFFPTFSNFYSELACFLFLPETKTYVETKLAYKRFVDDFGPDDFNTLKRLSYTQLNRMSLPELIAMLRLSAYDSTFFENILPRFKQVARQVTLKERGRIAQSLHRTWKGYFSLQGSFDLAYEMGGIFYDLGYYKEALQYFHSSVNSFGEKADIFYNKALCHYQLREDTLFTSTLLAGKAAFPDYERFAHLDKLDLGAA